MGHDSIKPSKLGLLGQGSKKQIKRIVQMVHHSKKHAKSFSFEYGLENNLKQNQIEQST